MNGDNYRVRFDLADLDLSDPALKSIREASAARFKEAYRAHCRHINDLLCGWIVYVAMAAPQSHLLQPDVFSAMFAEWVRRSQSVEGTAWL